MELLLKFTRMVAMLQLTQVVHRILKVLLLFLKQPQPQTLGQVMWEWLATQELIM